MNNSKEAVLLRKLAVSLCPECKDLYTGLLKMQESDDIERQRLADNEVLRRQTEREEDLMRKDD